MGPFHILLDEMGLDQMGLDKVGRPHTLLYWYEFILLFLLWYKMLNCHSLCL